MCKKRCGPFRVFFSKRIEYTAVLLREKRRIKEYGGKGLSHIWILNSESEHSWSHRGRKLSLWHTSGQAQSINPNNASMFQKVKPARILATSMMQTSNFPHVRNGSVCQWTMRAFLSTQLLEGFWWFGCVSLVTTKSWTCIPSISGSKSFLSLLWTRK